MSGRLKKIIWLILMTELVVLHLAVLEMLYMRGHKILSAILIAGFVFVAVFHYLSYRGFVRKCVSTIRMLEDEKTNEFFEEAKAQSGNLAEKLRIYESSDAVNPFVVGAAKPAVILPASCKGQANLRLILLHECFHVKRGDTRYKLAMLIANCILWYNPLAYFIRYVSYQDIEISCDEAVVKGKSREERLAYGQFLIDSARNMNRKADSYNAYWNSSKRILKHRIDAVVNENRKWDIFAKCAIIVLALEVICSGGLLGRKLVTDYKETTGPVNEYDGVTPPDIYNEEAIASMLSVDLKSDYTEDAASINAIDELYPQKELSQISVQAENPWQIKVKRPGVFKVAAETALQRLYYYWENPTGFDMELYEASPYQSNCEIVYEKRLAGDIDNSVWGIMWRVYYSDIESSQSYKDGYGFTIDGEENYLYYATAVQIKMEEPYLFEVIGYADLYKTFDAYKEKYDIDYESQFPKLLSGAETGEMDLSSQKELADSLAESKGLWDAMISFPENENEGYMLATADKAMMQVYSVLYYTSDAGQSWRQIEMDDVGSMHDMVYDFAFINKDEGYMALQSFDNQPPQLLRTENGGYNWESIVLTKEQEDFCQAYAPIWDGEKYIVYVGKEGSARDEGEKACYESTDGGKSWSYTGQVVLQ